AHPAPLRPWAVRAHGPPRPGLALLVGRRRGAGGLLRGAGRPVAQAPAAAAPPRGAAGRALARAHLQVRGGPRRPDRRHAPGRHRLRRSRRLADRAEQPRARDDLHRLLARAGAAEHALRRRLPLAEPVARGRAGRRLGRQAPGLRRRRRAAAVSRPPGLLARHADDLRVRLPGARVSGRRRPADALHRGDRLQRDHLDRDGLVRGRALGGPWGGLLRVLRAAGADLRLVAGRADHHAPAVPLGAAGLAAAAGRRRAAGGDDRHRLLRRLLRVGALAGPHRRDRHVAHQQRRLARAGAGARLRRRAPPRCAADLRLLPARRHGGAVLRADLGEHRRAGADVRPFAGADRVRLRRRALRQPAPARGPGARVPGVGPARQR
ncbi:MAG: hypothetical protein AVDCRST_MAG69-4, partial [uncultured Solirubrobacteraceae bacterium]